jgi:hypothetical protein
MGKRQMSGIQKALSSLPRGAFLEAKKQVMFERILN